MVYAGRHTGDDETHTEYPHSVLPEKVFQFFQCVFLALTRRPRNGFLEGKVIAEIRLVPGPLELSFRFAAYIVACYGIEPAVEAYVEVASAFRAGRFSCEVFVYINSSAAQGACFHYSVAP
jgi:hypothetical protein